ncbi:MAG: DUF11 domain-containing protein [Myxococcales bacterium]|nr:DUF11 domain-containing protein [Myxococcales bacterium]
MRHPSSPVLARFSWFLLAALALVPTSAAADEPLQLRYQYSGSADFFATGATIAVDGNDADANADALLHPAITTVTNADIPAGASLRRAFLYWGGSIANDNCTDTTIDDQVTFTAPGQPSGPVLADVCYCSDAAAMSYDMQLCRADVTELLEDLTGDYAVDDFEALIENGDTNAASFSIVLVYSAPDLPARNVALYDGLLTMWSNSNPSTTVILDGLEIDNPPVGDLTWYAIEGDTNGIGQEGVSVEGKPGGSVLALFDPLNPVDNPMNHTINTTTPPQIDSVGVDIDEFDISPALAAGDSSVETTYLAGSDKYWIGYNIVGVNVFAPVIEASSSKDWTLFEDLDQSNDPSPGDRIRYTITLENSGNAPGLISVEDPIPAEAEPGTWTLVDAGVGVDASTADTLIVTDIALDVGESTQIVFDLTIADVPDGTVMVNIADWSAPPKGGMGQLVAPPVPISNPAAGDTTTDGGDTTTDGGDTTTDGDSSGESGSDGSSGTDSSADGNDEVSADGTTGGIDGDEGCNCKSDGNGSRGAPLLLLLALAGLRRPRRRLG